MLCSTSKYQTKIFFTLVSDVELVSPSSHFFLPNPLVVRFYKESLLRDVISFHWNIPRSGMILSEVKD